MQEKKNNGFAIAALVLGIIGFCIGIFPLLGWLGLPFWLLGLIFGIIGLFRPNQKGLAVTGIILSIVMFAYQVIIFFGLALYGFS